MPARAAAKAIAADRLQAQRRLRLALATLALVLAAAAFAGKAHAAGDSSCMWNKLPDADRRAVIALIVSDDIDGAGKRLTANTDGLMSAASACGATEQNGETLGGGMAAASLKAGLGQGLQQTYGVAPARIAAAYAALPAADRARFETHVARDDFAADDFDYSIGERVAQATGVTDERGKRWVFFYLIADVSSRHYDLLL